MRWIIITALLALVACKDEQAKAPDPVPLTETDVSYFCQMNVLDHGGPKAQIHLEGQTEPLFFAQVRDGIAYLKTPERDARVVAVYVSDMGAAPAWSEPGTENWIAADQAVFVVGAGVAGGMGVPEIVPFAEESAAEAFQRQYGGQIVPLDAIPDAAALGPVDTNAKLETPS